LSIFFTKAIDMHIAEFHTNLVPKKMNQGINQGLMILMCFLFLSSARILMG
jgi:hypothetical protein